MTWSCPAIDHGVTIFPNGKIGPCCQISADYLKPVSELNNPKRFADLKTDTPPAACSICINNEKIGVSSYRDFFRGSATSAPGLQFVDIRNTNLCNLKCRYCGPHFSNQWAEELKITPIIQNTDFADYKNILISDSLHWMYFTGGEPLISATHWQLLEELSNTGLSQQISLMYNSNLTTIKYKDKNIIDIWQHFKKVHINISIDAVDKPLEYIRSGCDWNKIKSNIAELKTLTKNSNISLGLSPVFSILNLWFLDQLYEYAQLNDILVSPIVLNGPDYLALNVMPTKLKSQALDLVAQLEEKFTISNAIIDQVKNLINNNENEYLFHHTITHVLLLDNLRGEKLFDLLPFKSIAIDNILKNHEYE